MSSASATNNPETKIMEKSGFKNKANAILDKVEAKLDKLEAKLPIIWNNFRIYFGALRFNFIIVFLTIFIFTSPDQCKDLLNGLIDDAYAGYWWKMLGFWFSLVVLSLAFWYGARISLKMADLSKLKPIRDKETGKEDNTKSQVIDNSSAFQKWIKSFLQRRKDFLKKEGYLINRLPRILAFSVFIIICFAFNADEIKENSYGWWFLITGIGVIGIFYLTLERNRERRLKALHKRLKLETDKTHGEIINECDHYLNPDGYKKESSEDYKRKIRELSNRFFSSLSDDIKCEVEEELKEKYPELTAGSRSRSFSNIAKPSYEILTKKWTESTLELPASEIKERFEGLISSINSYYDTIEPSVELGKEGMSWDQLRGEDRNILWALSIFVLLTVIASLFISFNPIKPVWLPQLFGSVTLVSFFLAGLLIFVTGVWAWWSKAYLPMIVPFILFVFFLLAGNNHHIRLVKEENNKRPEIVQTYSSWIKKSVENSPIIGDKKFPIYLVAAEGGGVRSMKWTALVLDQLYNIPHFSDHIFALSGVSGGSVGSIFQQSSLAASEPAATQEEKRELLEKSIQADFLSPVTFGLLFPDLVHRVLPVATIEEWDRSRWLEDAFRKSFKSQYETSLMDEGLAQHWNTRKQRTPHIFLNCTSLETGQKALITDVALNPSYFANTIDLLAEISTAYPERTGIPLKTAASLSARFPLVTSAGKIHLNDTRSLQVADGGYHDNTGLETISQLINMILRETDPELLKKIQLNIIVIKNSEDKDTKSVESSDWLVDLNGPLNTLLSNWGNSTVNTLCNTETLLKSLQNLQVNIDLKKFQLNRNIVTDKRGKITDEGLGEKIVLPLGWYLSTRANKEISRQVTAITNPDTTLMYRSRITIENFENFQHIKGELANIYEEKKD